MATQQIDKTKKTTNKGPLLAFGGIFGVAILGWLIFGFFGIQTAFIDNEVDQAGPVFGQSELVDTEAGVDAVDATGGVGEVVTQFSGNFFGEPGYTVVGDALVLNDGSDQRFLRFENFSTNNGPDLKVVLRAENGDLINLGPLQGNIGDQNYELSPDIDLNVYNTVEIYCERFSVLFGSAPITPTGV